MKKLSEKELVLLAQAGDQKSINMLFEKMHKIIPISLKRTFRTVDHETIQDITQIALMKGFKNLNKYNATYTFNTWVTTIARNAMIDHFRKNKYKIIEV